MNEETKDGWIVPPNLLEAHYFHNGISLCGMVRYWPQRPERDGKYRDSCEHCLRLRQAQLTQLTQLPLFIDDNPAG